MNGFFEMISGNVTVFVAIVSLFVLILWLIFFMRSEFKVFRAEMAKGFSEVRAAIIQGDNMLEGTFTLEIQKVKNEVSGLRNDMDYGFKDLRKDMEQQGKDMVQQGEDIRSEMAQLGKDIRAEMTELGKDIRTEMRQGFKDIRAEMDQQGKDIRTEMRQGFKDIRAEMDQQGNDIRAEMAEQGKDIRTEMRQGFKDIRTEMKDGFTKRDHEFEKTLTTLKISGKEDPKPHQQQKQQ